MFTSLADQIMSCSLDLREYSTYASEHQRPNAMICGTEAPRSCSLPTPPIRKQCVPKLAGSIPADLHILCAPRRRAAVVSGATEVWPAGKSSVYLLIGPFPENLSPSSRKSCVAGASHSATPPLAAGR